MSQFFYSGTMTVKKLWGDYKKQNLNGTGIKIGKCDS